MRHRMGSLPIFAVLLIIFMPVLCFLSADNNEAQDTRVSRAAAIIHILGTAQDPDPNASVGQLHEVGREAVPLLIQALHIVDPDAGGDEWLHMVWCERALRSITGQRFTFRTLMKLTRWQREHLNPKEPMGYFQEWMSRARIYVAPRDVQEKVIASWRAWLKKNGKIFTIQHFEPYGDWYF